MCKLNLAPVPVVVSYNKELPKIIRYYSLNWIVCIVPWPLLLKNKKYNKIRRPYKSFATVFSIQHISGGPTSTPLGSRVTSLIHCILKGVYRLIKYYVRLQMLASFIHVASTPARSGHAAWTHPGRAPSTHCCRRWGWWRWGWAVGWSGRSRPAGRPGCRGAPRSGRTPLSAATAHVALRAHTFIHRCHYHSYLRDE